jgi:superfamily II DNA or RNA helicase
MKIIEIKSMALVEGEGFEISKLKASLHVTNTYRDFTLPLYKEEGKDRLWVPRALVKKPADDANWQKINLKSDIELRSVQKKIIDMFFEQLEKFPCGGIISAPTGSGKTYMGIDIICRLGLKAIVIVPTDRIYGQWIERIKLLTNAGKVGRIRAHICDVDAPITVAMLHTVCKERYDWLEKEFGVVIYDECLHPSHEILTSKGWKKVSEVNDADDIAQVEPTTGQITFTKPLKVIRRFYEGDLIHFSNMFVDLLGTPNHEHLVYARWRNSPKKVKFKDLRHSSYYKWAFTGTVFSDPSDRLRDIERLYIAYQADGTVIGKRKDKQIYTIRFSFRRKHKVERLTSLLSKLGIKYKTSTNCRGDVNVWFNFPEIPPKNFSWVGFDRSIEYYRDFLDEIVKWDGWTSKKGHRFFETRYKELCDTVQIAALLAGYPSTITLTGKNRWRVRWYKDKLLREVRDCRKNIVPYRGNVYCVTMPHGTIITRRNNKVVVTGNCHTISTEHFHPVAQKFWSKVNIGFSATPRRKDGMQNVFFYHIGPVVARYDKSEVKPKFIIVRYYNPQTHHYGCRLSTGELNLGKYMNRIASNRHRNRLLAKYIRATYTRGHQILILTDRLDHIETLIKLSALPQADVGRLTSTKKEIDRQVIFGTYGSAGLGLDIPTLTCLILASPRADIVQAVGRIMRSKDRQPIVIDIVDEASRVMEQWFQKRVRYYKTLSDDIITLSEGIG